MSASNRIGRRGFLAAALGVTATALTARFAFERTATEDDLSSDAERLVGAFPSTESAAELGRAYLATVALERSPNLLVERIVTGLPGGYASVRGNEAHLQTLLAQRLKEDFRRGHTVTVDGWILSRTEARLFALAAIAESGS